MQYKGVLRKMQTEIGSPIQYYMLFESDFLNINQILDKTLKIEFIKHQCLNCGNDRPIYRQGFCRTCFFEIPSAGDWIMRPELSKAHLDQEDRDLAYEKKVQLQPHIVYLANSSNVKVGVTRKGQVPTRWIDQGAHEAIEIVEVPNRYLAGITEVALKDHVGDKTNWRTMLTNNVVDENLQEWRNKLKQYIPQEALPYYLESNLETTLEFPVLQYPTKVKSLNLSKTPTFEGILKGIKGQYLIFQDNTVFNVRGSEGYYVGLTIS
jgi:ribosomal protein S14